MKELTEIQTRLKAPKGNAAKGQGGRILYRYRSCEDILEAAKGLLKELGCHIVVTDEVLLVGSRFYIKATATLTNGGGESVSATAYAREPDALATMNQSQVTGAASSYARKYALNGLLAIDDTKDADTVPQEAQAAGQNPADIFAAYAKPAIEQAQTKEDLTRLWNDYASLQGYRPFMEALTSRRKALGIKNSNEQ